MEQNNEAVEWLEDNYKLQHPDYHQVPGVSATRAMAEVINDFGYHDIHAKKSGGECNFPRCSGQAMFTTKSDYNNLNRWNKKFL